ncbi:MULTISPECIES: DUF983 domain-containing protein [Thalassospira]|jgi:uncharacterized protein (DUF983 family)|uniref:DUF983 domain-containing protein n=1 Tax=Thalassospira xiamenensis TaxID=220697 RepID=A0ABR5Y4L5_9PROT|nr:MULTISPECIES: DUF983 domain-containing protein [Thalassospira]KZD05435.1 hypothetical protein AUP40_00440 [Thalassospira xiamenensis]KZD11495.1 hypothetical protein AUP45_06420 [Thalassospira xiamenensis]MAB35321.1 DUF983 domain-containing protein [Thalassospira sp.]MBA06024.1 DUF983 domain-containing protein [Thalassospira sp.]MCD1593004.1 DUF983 domain-containing protein [Thalassospira xiamenensis]|tara:strand:- start:2803 stop:3171 length:369 start_codon:yes stop_codon:yes gene_type:complete
MTMDYYPALSPIRTGLACKCPRCGGGKLFSGFLTVRESCEQCGLDLRGHDAGDGPAIFIIFILGFVVVPLALWVEMTYMPPLWLHAVLWFPTIIGVTLALLRPLKGLMVALQYRHRSTSEQD